MDIYEKTIPLTVEDETELKVAVYAYGQPADMILYQGWSKEKLGDNKEANARFYSLIDYGE